MFVRKLLGLAAVGGGSTLGGGTDKSAGASLSTVAGGFLNSAGASGSTVGGGSSNQATAIHATIAGGASNIADHDYSTIGGCLLNSATGFGATVAGGASGSATATYATVGGGQTNRAVFLLEDSNVELPKRRSFIKKIASLSLAGALAGSVLGRFSEKTLLPAAEATPGGGTGTALIIDGSPANTGTSATELNSTTASVAAFVGHTTASSGSAYGLWGQSDSPDGIGVVGSNNSYTGNARGVWGLSPSSTGTGVRGSATATTGSADGVVGESSAPNGNGVFGYASATSGTATGVYGESFSSDGRGVWGVAAATSGFAYGVVGESDSTLNGVGVAGYANATSGISQGVYGKSSSPDGTGVVGYALATIGPAIGVRGTSNSANGVGVQGVAGNNGAKPMVAQGASGQTASLQEWQNNVGTALSVVTSSGSLGIGTGTPVYALDLRTSGSSSSQMHLTSADADSGGYLTSANAGNLFMSAGAAWNGSAWVAKSSTSYQYGGGVAGVRFFFDTGLTVGATYTPTTRMFIGPTGHVGIGLSTAPAHLLQLGLDDAAKPSTSTWTIASDGRLKDPESIEPFTEGSDMIKRLPQPVWFRYRKESGLPSDRRVAGWIAQDVAPVAPFMVRRTKQKLSVYDVEETETLSLNTNELPYAMLNSIKELLEDKVQVHEQVAKLLDKQEKLEDENHQLRDEMEKLKQAQGRSIDYSPAQGGPRMRDRLISVARRYPIE